MTGLKGRGDGNANYYLPTCRVRPLKGFVKKRAQALGGARQKKRL